MGADGRAETAHARSGWLVGAGRGKRIEQRCGQLPGGVPELECDELAGALVCLAYSPRLLMPDGMLAVEARQNDPGDVGISIVVTVEGHHAEEASAAATG